jgi:hypothetical protein
MAKHPIFLRIKTSDQAVICINPLQLSSFQILEKAKIKDKDGNVQELDTVRFYFPQGTGLSYSVGIDLTQQEFNYICSTLLEFLYLNEFEYRAKTEAAEKKKVEEWNKIMAAEAEEEKELTEKKA